MIPTKEQIDIIEKVKEGKNIKIEAVAGSGKTTTLLMVANELEDKNICLLTYSRALKDEILKKPIPRNLSVYTFHSFASYIYEENIHNDYLLNNCLLNNKINKDLEIDILMVDEVQDMTKQYFLLISLIIKKIPDIKLILVGDEKQTIKDYIGAYSNFLTDAEFIYKKYTNLNGPWDNCKLSKSYRLTENVTKFVNKHIYKEDYIISGNNKSNNFKPDYLPITNIYVSKNKINPDITKIIYHYIKQYGINNILILAPSYRVNNPGYLLAHELSDISHIIPNQETEDKLNPLLLQNKLVFRTFASCKGLQSKCVIILGLDENYFKFNDRFWTDEENLPNILSVVATRAQEKLVIIANENKTLRTIIYKDLKKDVNILSNSLFIKAPKIEKKIENNDMNKSVVDFVKHKHPEIEELALLYLNIENSKINTVGLGLGTLAPMAQNMIRFITKNNKEIYESVGHLYGRIIPKIFQYLTLNDNILYYTELIDYPFNKNDIYLELYNEYMDYLNSIIIINSNNIDYIKYIKHIFACEVLLESVEIKSLYLVRQINNFNWINTEVIENSLIMLKNYLNISTGAIDIFFEYTLDSMKINNINICGRVDLLYKDIIYEFKYTENIINEHILQLGVYLCLYSKAPYGIIISYPTGNITKVEIKQENKTKFIETLSLKNINNNLSIYEILDIYMEKVNIIQSKCSDATMNEFELEFAL
jgi:hypothetical protein